MPDPEQRQRDEQRSAAPDQAGFRAAATQPAPSHGACGPGCKGHTCLRTALENAELVAHRMAVAAAEAGRGVPIGHLDPAYPGLQQLRDLAMVALVARAESVAIGRLLVEAKIVTEEQVEDGTAAVVEELVAQRSHGLLAQLLQRAAAQGPVIHLQVPHAPPPPPPSGQEVA